MRSFSLGGSAISRLGIVLCSSELVHRWRAHLVSGGVGRVFTHDKRIDRHRQDATRQTYPVLLSVAAQDDDFASPPLPPPKEHHPSQHLMARRVCVYSWEGWQGRVTTAFPAERRQDYPQKPTTPPT